MRGLPATAAGPAAEPKDAPARHERFLIWPVHVLSRAHTGWCWGAGAFSRTRARGLRLMCHTGRGPGRETVVLSGLLEVIPMADTATATMGPLTVVTFAAEIDMATAGAIGEQIAAALAPGVHVVIADM